MSGLAVLSIAITLLSLSGSHQAYGENQPEDLTQLSMEQLLDIDVYGASKFKQKATEAPSSVSVVTADEIKKYGYRTLADILKGLRSFHVSYDRNYSYVGSRGFGPTGDYNGRILVLVDGHRINDNLYDSVLVGTGFPVDIDLVDKVEVIRGPGSSLYGNNALFAVVNVLTKSGDSFKGAELSGEVASFGTYAGRASGGNRFDNGFDFTISATRYSSRGQNLFFKEFADPSTNTGVAYHCDQDQDYSVLGKASFKGFTLEAAYVDRYKHIPTASYDTIFNQRITKTEDSLGYLDLSYQNQFDNGINLLSRLYYNSYDYEGYWAYLSDQGAPYLNRDFGKGEWWGGEITATKAIMERHKVTIGAECQVNKRQDQGNYDVDPYYVWLSDRRKSNRWAVYGQDEISILQNLILNLGIRDDHYSTFGNVVNPRIAVIYSPIKTGSLKLLYGSAFRAPNDYEMFYRGGGNEANPGLRPERVKTYEVVYEQFVHDRLKLTAAGFYYRIYSHIQQQTGADGGLVFTNSGEVTAKGIEFEAESKWTNGFQGRLSYSYQDTIDGPTGSIPVNSPRNLAKLNIIVPLMTNMVFAGLEAQYVGPRKAPNNFLNKTLALPDWALAYTSTGGAIIGNITILTQNIVKGLEVSLSAYNIFDKKYADPAGDEHFENDIPQDGRSYRLKVTYRFL